MNHVSIGSNGRVIPPVTYSEEQIEALTLDTIEINANIVQHRGFQRLEYQTSRFTKELRQKVKAVYSSNFSTFFGYQPADRFEDFFSQLSNFASHLAKNHCFTDGNKRTTVKISFALVAHQGIHLDIKDDQDPELNELYQWIQDIVTGAKSQEELAQALREHVVS